VVQHGHGRTALLLAGPGLLAGDGWTGWNGRAEGPCLCECAAKGRATAANQRWLGVG
jgi:hypothetical protein